MEYTLSVAKAAQEMGVSPKGVLDLIESGVLPAAKLGKGYIIRKSDVVKHIDLSIAMETSKRIEQYKLKTKRADTQIMVQTQQSPAQSKPGRKRNQIPDLPNFVSP